MPNVSNDPSRSSFTAPVPVAAVPPPAESASRWWPHGLTAVAVLALCWLVIWFQLGAVPINSRSESRYASVSAAMADGGGWLVPTFMGHPHLTKPPLTYWLQAGCFRLFGYREWALRLPTAVAGSLVILLTLALAWRRYGRAVGLLAAGVLAIMPMHVIVSRLALTDGLLALFWLSALAAGLTAVHQPTQKRWPALLWLAVALGLLTKGPVAWTPIGLLVIWLALGRRWKDLAALRLGYGLALSLLPLVAWVALVLYHQPQAAALWYREMVLRATGQGDHPKPIWYFLPVFLGCLFPATLMLNLPGINYPIRWAWQALRRGEEACLWALAVVLPLVMFSLIKGKLPSYLLPLCPPLAILTGRMLWEWVRGRADQPAPGVRPPEVTIAPLVMTGTIAAALTLGFWLPAAWLESLVATLNRLLHLPLERQLDATLLWNLRAAANWLPLLPLVLLAACAAHRWLWRHRPQRRMLALTLLWLATVAAWLAGFALERQLGSHDSVPALVERIRHDTGLAQPAIATFGMTDPTLGFYNGRTPSPRLNDTQVDPEPPQSASLSPAAHSHPELNLDRFLQAHGANLVVVADPGDWRAYQRRYPHLAAHLQEIFTWPRWPTGRAWLILRAKAQ